MIDPQEEQQEQQRVTDVIAQIDDQIETASQVADKAHHETRAVEKNYADNASVNLYEVDDAMETNAMIEQQRQLVARAVESETILKRQLETLKAQKQAPYFGRIDIQDNQSEPSEPLYIGIASLMNKTKDDFLVYDWRAPVSGIYYNGTLGQVSYDSPAGKQTTNLVKKRQFTIEDGQIVNVFDTNETVGDEMLQTALGQQNDQYMQNIVTTIQKEQNDIIRNTSSDLLLVQGVAGSGKTSAILQRIAYLLYHSRASLNADQIVLFSPNRLFSHYISEVLPSLGERNMRQVTLAEFLERRFEGLTVQTLFERYEDQQQNKDNNLAVQNFLESQLAMTEVDRYVRTLGADEIKFNNILFNGSVIFSAQLIQQIFDNLPLKMHIADKILATKNALIKLLKHQIDEQTKEKWVADEVDQLSNEQFNDLLMDHAADSFQTEDEMFAFVAQQIAKSRLRVVYDAIYNNYFIDFYRQYDAFLSSFVPENVSESDWQATRDGFNHQIEFHQIDLMHCAPLLYMRDLITGSGQNRALEYVFIDEMQDYSMATLIYLKHVFVKAKFTILGDSEQSLFNPMQLPQVLMASLKENLNFKKSTLISLNRSYRSTAEITNFAKSLLPDGDEISAFNRHGERPNLVIRYTPEEFQDTFQGIVEEQTKKYKTVAILTKNAKQAFSAKHRLRHFKNEPVTLLKDADRVLPAGVIILPIYLAKGLEFDSVIAYDVSEDNYHRDTAAGILYTIASRAMHELTLLSMGPASPLLIQNEEPLIEINHQL